MQTTMLLSANKMFYKLKYSHITCFNLMIYPWYCLPETLMPAPLLKIEREILCRAQVPEEEAEEEPGQLSLQDRRGR